MPPQSRVAAQAPTTSRPCAERHGSPPSASGDDVRSSIRLCLARCERYAPSLSGRVRHRWSRAEGTETCMLRDRVDGHDDLRLVQSALAGDRASMDEVMRRLACVPLILRVRNEKLGRPLDADLLQDVAQDTLVAVWTRLSAFGGASSLEAWVYRFCVHKHLTRIRDRGRRGRIESVESPLLEQAEATEREAAPDEELLHRSLDELDADRARIVRLKHFEGLTFEQIAARLSISPNTAKTQYYRALRVLREYLHRHAGGEGP